MYTRWCLYNKHYTYYTCSIQYTAYSKYNVAGEDCGAAHGGQRREPQAAPDPRQQEAHGRQGGTCQLMLMLYVIIEVGGGVFFWRWLCFGFKEQSPKVKKQKIIIIIGEIFINYREVGIVQTDLKMLVVQKSSYIKGIDQWEKRWVESGSIR